VQGVNPREGLPKLRADWVAARDTAGVLGVGWGERGWGKGGRAAGGGEGRRKGCQRVGMKGWGAGGDRVMNRCASAKGG
jgi:hypothetical protein